MANKVMSGARAKIGVLDPKTGKVSYRGIFTSVSWGLSFDAQPVYILGRFSAAAIEYTAQEVVNINCSGWRVFGHGAHKDGGLPALQDLLTHEYIVITVVDRQNPTKNMATFKQVRPVSMSTSVNSRNLQEISMAFVGIQVDDEDTQNVEAPGSMDLP